MRPDQPPPYPDFVPPRRAVPWVTWFLVSSTVAMFLSQMVCLHLFGGDVLGETLAFSPQAMAEERYWTLLTYAWVHAVAMFGDSGLFWLHIFANMIVLICLGPALEALLGHMRYLALYLGGAIVSALVWYYFNAHSEEGIIGASGAIFALIAAIGTAAPRERVTVYLFYILPLRMSLGVLAVAICGAEAVQIIFHWLPEVAHSAHLGGAAFGFLYVVGLRLARRTRHLSI